MEELLKQILETQKQIQATLQQQGEILQQHSETLQQHSVILQQHSIQLDALQKGQLRLEARLENEVIAKVRALFDGFTLRGDQIERLQKRLDERLDSIETDTRYLVARVAMLKLAK